MVVLFFLFLDLLCWKVSRRLQGQNLIPVRANYLLVNSTIVILIIKYILDMRKIKVYLLTFRFDKEAQLKKFASFRI